MYRTHRQQAGCPPPCPAEAVHVALSGKVGTKDFAEYLPQELF